jgi:hypothetical protein
MRVRRDRVIVGPGRTIARGGRCVSVGSNRDGPRLFARKGSEGGVPQLKLVACGICIGALLAGADAVRSDWRGAGASSPPGRAPRSPSGRFRCDVRGPFGLKFQGQKTGPVAQLDSPTLDGAASSPGACGDGRFYVRTDKPLTKPAITSDARGVGARQHPQEPGGEALGGSVASATARGPRRRWPNSSRHSAALANCCRGSELEQSNLKLEA